jgi:hypothetical protein
LHPVDACFRDPASPNSYRLFGAAGPHRLAIMPSCYADDLTLCCISATYAAHCAQLAAALQDLEQALKARHLSLSFKNTILTLLRTAPGPMSVLPSSSVVSPLTFPHVEGQQLSVTPDGFVLLGAPFSADTDAGRAFLRDFFTTKERDVAADLARLGIICSEDPTVYYHLLSRCLVPTCEHLVRCCPPDGIFLDFCSRIHAMFLAAFFERVVGTPIQLLGTIVSAAMIRQAAAQIGLPLRLGGFGMRNLLIQENNLYTAPLESLKTRTFVMSFCFEG